RQECEVRLDLTRTQSSQAILIFGDDEVGFKNAYNLIWRGFEQICWRYFDPPQYFFLKASSLDALRQSVRLTPYRGPMLTTGRWVNQDPIGCTVKFEGLPLRDSDLRER